MLASSVKSVAFDRMGISSSHAEEDLLFLAEHRPSFLDSRILSKSKANPGNRSFNVLAGAGSRSGGLAAFAQ